MTIKASLNSEKIGHKTQAQPFMLECRLLGRFVPILHNSIYFQYRFPSHVISPLTYIYSKSCIRCVKQIFSFSSNCENMCTMFTFHLVLVLCALCPRNVAKKYYKYASVQAHTASTRHACTHPYGH